MHRATRVARNIGRRLAHSRRLAGAFLLALLLLDAGWRGVSAGADLFRAYRELSAAAATLDLAGDSLPTSAEYREVRLRVTDATERVARAHGRLAYLRPAIRAMGILPIVGPSARDATRLLDAGADVAPALQQLLAAGAPLIEDPEAPLVTTARSVLVDDAARILAGFDAVEAAGATFQAIEPTRWVWPMSRSADDATRFAKAVADLRAERETFAAISENFDRLFGYGASVQWLVIGQNDQELRPTGGFMGSMGLVTLEDGEVTAQDYRSSVEFDPAGGPPGRTPPAPLIHYLGLGDWYVRDANWSPDFPSSAEEILALLQQDQGLAPAGIVALDSHAVALLIEVFGPLAVPEYPEPLTPENWFRLAEEAVTGFAGNPTAANGTTTGWSTVEPNTLAPVRFTSEGVTTEGLPGGVTTGLRTTVNGATRLSAYPVQLDPGIEYAGSIYVLIPEDWDGGTISLDMPEFDGMEGGGPVALDASVRGRWQRVETRGRTAADGSGNLRLTTDAQPTRGRSVLVTLAAVEPVDGEGLARTAASQQAKQAYLRPVLEVLLQQAQSAPAARLPALVRALRRAAEGRHLQAYHRDPAAEDALDRIGLGGALRAAPGAELLAVIDANVTYSKIQPAIAREITVLLRQDGGRDVVIRWHNGVDAMKLDRSTRLGTSGTTYRHATGEYLQSPGVFGTYTRVYAPRGSTLDRTAGFDGPPGMTFEGDLVAIGGYAEIAPGETQQVVVSYTPGTASEALHVWKQGGTTADHLVVLRNVAGAQETLFEGPLLSDVVIDLR